MNSTTEKSCNEPAGNRSSSSCSSRRKEANREEKHIIGGEPELLLSNRGGNTLKKAGSARKGAGLDEFTRKEWKQSAKKRKVNPQQHKRGNPSLTRNFSLWSESLRAKSYRVRRGRAGSLEPVGKKGKQLLTKLGMKDGWIGSEQSEGKPVHQMGMVA